MTDDTPEQILHRCLMVAWAQVVAGNMRDMSQDEFVRRMTPEMQPLLDVICREQEKP